MNNLKIFLTTLLIAVLLICATSIVFATENSEFPFQEDNPVTNSANAANTQNQGGVYSITDSATNDVANNTTNNATNNATNNSTNNAVNNVTNSNTSVYNNTDLPDAGSTDGIIIVAIIAVFGISALYAYKKIREYNV